MRMARESSILSLTEAAAAKIHKMNGKERKCATNVKFIVFSVRNFRKLQHNFP